MLKKNEEKEIEKAIDKIKNYPKGFEFTINYSSISTKAKENGLKYVLKKAKDMGLIECIATGLTIEDITGKSGRPFNEETFRRL
jgi:hypothetical protein